MMKTYLVGGAVRDLMQNVDPKDRDFVIVGATPEDIDNLVNVQGYQKVGADFPVFLHPVSGEEYALARIERKIAAGYNGFEAFTSPDLTLEDDLRRRDLTINAMAMDMESGEVFDFFGGKKDLEDGVIRHVSEAFSEDPLRVLRAARFAARYNFTIHPDTKALMETLVHNGELDSLSRERVWVEIEKMLSEKDAHVGIQALLEVGALQRLFGENIAFYVKNFTAYEEWLEPFRNLDIVGKFCWFAFGSKWTDADMQRMKIPRHFQQAHVMFDKVLTKFGTILGACPSELMEFLELTASLKTSHVFESIKGALSTSSASNPEKRLAHIELAKQAALSVDCESIAKHYKSGPMIAEAIREERIFAIEQAVIKSLC